MARPVTLFTGQWADLPLETLAAKAKAMGFDGLELACWGDHFEVDKALSDDSYIRSRHDILARHGLKCYAISTHLVGQCVADAYIDERHKSILPGRLWGDGDAEGVRQRCAEEVKQTAHAAKLMGVEVVNGFTGSPVWHLIYRFPPTSDEMIDNGFKEFGERWKPILDVFQQQGIKYALEAHPAEIAYDIYTAQKAVDAVGGHPAFGFNFDPSHFIHQLFNPVHFIEHFPDRIFHVHVKDSKVNLTGMSSILGSHLQFGDSRRGWNFVSSGRGDMDLEAIIRVLNRIGYTGALSVEWEDAGMDREHGAKESLEFIRRTDFAPAAGLFDAAYASKD